MLTFLVLAVGAVMVLVLVLLAIVVIGMRQEAPTEELNMQAPGLLPRWSDACSGCMSASRIRALMSGTANRG
jgi:hypothetical protein